MHIYIFVISMLIWQFPNVSLEAFSFVCLFLILTFLQPSTLQRDWFYYFYCCIINCLYHCNSATPLGQKHMVVLCFICQLFLAMQTDLSNDCSYAHDSLFLSLSLTHSVSAMQHLLFSLIQIYSLYQLHRRHMEIALLGSTCSQIDLSGGGLMFSCYMLLLARMQKNCVTICLCGGMKFNHAYIQLVEHEEESFTSCRIARSY